MSNSTLPIAVTSPDHFKTLLETHTYLIADFYATWCPPCKVIAPLYEQLCGQHSAEGKFGFVKVNVDDQPEIAAQYGITALPTFRVLKRKLVPHEKCEIVRGADVKELKRVVEDIVARLAKQEREKEEGEEKGSAN
jgi:thioredoxin 1